MPGVRRPGPCVQTSMTRRLLNLLTVLLIFVSLLLCVGSVVLWVRSDRTGDFVSWAWYRPVDSAGAAQRWRGAGGGLVSGRGGVSVSGWHTLKPEAPQRPREFRWGKRLNPAYAGTLPGRSAWGTGSVAGFSAPVTGPSGVEGRIWE